MPPRVLYVDDHEDTCALMRLVLTLHGYEVSVVAREVSFSDSAVVRSVFAQDDDTFALGGCRPAANSG